MVQRVLLVVWVVYGALSEVFTLTRGLAYLDTDRRSGLAYVAELQSSGGNDNICIEIGVVFSVVGALWAVLRRNRGFGLRDFALNVVLVVLQGVYLAAVEMGSVWTTVVQDRNFVLALWVILYGVLVVLPAVAMFGSLRRTDATR